MDTLPKTRIDISKIKGPYTLLALLLIVIEGLLGFWLFQAESVIERVLCGFFMTLIIGSFLWVVVRINTSREQSTRPIIPQDLDTEVTPAQQEATEQEIENPEPQMMGAPDGSYIINKPPDDWIVTELGFTEWITQSLAISTEKESEKQKAESVSQELKLHVFRSRRDISIIPIPGRTLVEGRKAPTALERIVNPQLAILPINRAQPPLFVERSLTHNVTVFIGQMMGVGIFTLQDLSSGIIQNSQRRYLSAEFSQLLENVIVNGKESKSTKINGTVIGIEGDLVDHILIMRYPFLPVLDDPELESDLETLESLVNSFRPLKVINPAEKRDEIRRKSDQNFKELMVKKGEELFMGEFAILLLRLKDLNLSDPEQRLRAITMLKPFEIFANQINLKDEWLDELWNSLHEAEAGDASNFKDYLTILKTELSDELLPLLTSSEKETEKKPDEKPENEAKST